MDGERLDSAQLYLAATRPAMIPWLGVPYGAGIVLITLAGLIMIYTHNPGYLIVLPPVWAMLLILVRHDHNALRVLDLWSRTSLLSIDAGLHGGASPDPAPIRRGKRKTTPRGVIHAA